MNAVAFLDPVQTPILSPLPVASCRSRDPGGRLLNSRQGREACILPLPTIQKVPGFTSEQHETRRVEGKAPLPRAEKKRALLILLLKTLFALNPLWGFGGRVTPRGYSAA